MSQSYQGPYVVTPEESGKTLSVAGRTCRQNVIVKAIPSDYVGSKVKRQAAKTITPSEKAQVALPKDVYASGTIMVAAIPPDYVGSEVPVRSSDDLTASGKTVTAPAGFYAANASKDVATGARGNSVHVIGYSGTKKTFKITFPDATSGWYNASQIKDAGQFELERQTETVTPDGTTQEVTPVNGLYYLEKVTVNPIPSQYYDMSGAMAWLGAGAELVTTFTLADVKLSDTDFATWTPSTTAADILATRNAGTFVADTSNYDYYLVWETKSNILSSSSAVKKALPIFLAGLHVQCINKRPGSFAQIEESNFSTNVSVNGFSGNFFRYYGTTTGTATYTWATSYGIYATATAATFSNTTADSPTVTVKSPKISARCSTTYMSTTNAGLIDKTNTIIKQMCTVYRVKKQTGFIRGAYDVQTAMVNDMIGG